MQLTGRCYPFDRLSHGASPRRYALLRRCAEAGRPHVGVAAAITAAAAAAIGAFRRSTGLSQPLPRGCAGAGRPDVGIAGSRSCRMLAAGDLGHNGLRRGVRLRRPVSI